MNIILSYYIIVAGAGVPLMAAGGGSGAITVWNLEQKRLHTLIRLLSSPLSLRDMALGCIALT